MRKEILANIKDGEVVLLENTRFEQGEEKRNEELCRKLADFCDIYVNDAFGTAHRSHATTAAIVEYGFVKEAVCGFLIEKELWVINKAQEGKDEVVVDKFGDIIKTGNKLYEHRAINDAIKNIASITGMNSQTIKAQVDAKAEVNAKVVTAHDVAKSILDIAPENKKVDDEIDA